MIQSVYIHIAIVLLNIRSPNVGCSMKKTFAIFSFFLLFLHPAMAQSVVSIQQIQLADGLSDQVIYGGYQDIEGFVWLASRNGLNRYDGHNILYYQKQSHGLQENKIIQLAGRKNTLFLLYGVEGSRQISNGKIDVFFTDIGRAKPLEEYIEDIPFQVSDVVWISSDTWGKVTFFTNKQQIWILDNTNQFYQISCDKHCENFKFTSNSNHLVFDNFIGIASMTLQQTVVIQDNMTHLLSGRDNTWFNMFIDRQVRPLKFENGLIFEYHIEGQSAIKIRQYDIEIHSNDIPFYHYNDPIAAESLVYLPEKGLFRLGPERAEYLTSDSVMTLHQDQINSFFVDRNGQYWLCTSTGVYIIDSSKNKFLNYFTAQKKDRKPNVTDQIRGIVLDDEGKLYASVWNQLGIVQPSTDEYGYISNIRNAILYPLYNHKGRIFGGSANLISLNNQGEIEEHAFFENQEIWSITSINDTLLLLGLSESLIQYNLLRNTYTSLENIVPECPPFKYIYRFIKMEDGRVLAVGESGIFEISEERKIINHLGDKVFGTERFHDLYVDNDSIYWIATADRGLIKYSTKTGRIKSYGRSQGFPSESLYRIESDQIGNLWISSQRGLIRFNTNSENLRIYLRKDGLPFDEFNRISSFRSKDNLLYFGGLNGLIAFDPTTFIEKKADNKFEVKLSAIHKFSVEKNNWINIVDQVAQSNELIIHPQDRLFNIAISMLDFQAGTYSFSYKFEGLDNQWNLLEDNIIRLTGLPHGDYILMVRGVNPNGLMTEDVQLLRVKVIAPFYIRGWFIFLCLFVLMAIIISVIKWKTTAIQVVNLELENLVSTRTQELARAVEYKDTLLKEVQHRIKNNLAIMDSMLELQKEKITNEEAIEAFEQSQSRLQSISLIHQNLSYKENSSEVNFKQFIEDLVQQSLMIVSGNSTDIKHEISLKNSWLSSEKAIPLGLILNELLTNSFKYARVPSQPLKIKIKLCSDPDQKISLMYQDNGPGIENIQQLKENSLGIRLIFLFCRQLGIDPKYDNSNGSFFTFIMNNPTKQS